MLDMEHSRSQALSQKRHTYDAQSTPPPFGHALLDYFGFDPAYVNLNHGSYGSLPLPVKSVVDKLSDEIEWNPDLFHKYTYLERLQDARRGVAELVGAKAEEIVIVENTSVGLNVILRNFAWNKGDILIGATTTYNSILATLTYLNDIHPHTTLAPFQLNFPTSHVDIITSFREHLRSLKRPSPSSENPEPKVVAIIDAIAANPGARLPWEELVKICKEENVWSVVDAAHAIGQQVDVNLSEIKPDFWVSNCHKWLFSKRGCAALYVPERNRHIIKASFPTSFMYRTNSTLEEWHAQFEWSGTIDFAPYLSITPALSFRKWLGGEAKINAYTHNLAMRGGEKLAEILGTQVMGNAEEITLNMTNVELPIPAGAFEHFGLVDASLKKRLLVEFNTYAAHYFHNGKWWARASAQVWNELSDFDVLGKALLVISQELAGAYEAGTLCSLDV